MLNAHYVALRVISARRAFSLLFKQDRFDQPQAEVVSLEDGRYVSYDFDDWRELSEFRLEFEPEKHDWVSTVRFQIAVPRILRVLSYHRLPRQQVKLNRRNIYTRDQNLCQYCGKRFKPSELSLDHVVPRSHGGINAWENLVCCCVRCNVKKGNRTPEQAGMPLKRKPSKPSWLPQLGSRIPADVFGSWQRFVDAAYWDVELRE